MIKIKYYKEANNPDSQVLASVSFYIEEWGLHLNGCRLIKSKNGGGFIGFPSSKVEKEGEISYHPHFCFDKDKNYKFQEAAKKAIKDHLAQ